MGSKEGAAKARAKSKPGRKKGSKNKFTTLKAAFLDAFNEIGGTSELARWGAIEKNKAQFYQMITKLLPKEIEGTLDVKAKPPNITVIVEDRE